jgi:hypothetical protein
MLGGMADRVVTLKYRIEHHRERLAHYEAALEAEIMKRRQASASPAIKRNGRAEMSKIDLVYTLIAKRPKRGATPAEIKELSEPYSIENGSNSYPYVMLWKLKKAGDIVERDGRYYPANP